MGKINVLFVCVHNSARSQMAEEFLNHYAGNKFQATSAGLEPGKINPVVIEILKEDNIDISDKKTNDVFEYFKKGLRFDFVITVCDESNGERCPLFPGTVKRLHWSFDDPSRLEGSRDEIILKTKEIREKIRAEILKLIDDFDDLYLSMIQKG